MKVFFVMMFTWSGLNPGGTHAYSSRAQPESLSELIPKNIQETLKLENFFNIFHIKIKQSKNMSLFSTHSKLNIIL